MVANLRDLFQAIGEIVKHQEWRNGICSVDIFLNRERLKKSNIEIMAVCRKSFELGSLELKVSLPPQYVNQS